MARELRITADKPVASLSDYEDQGGGHGLSAARHRQPESIIELLASAGLRGRGGAGFPTGRKWAAVRRAARGSIPPIVVNAAEGEPGTFKDRWLIRANPYAVLEGAYIAAEAMQADEILIGIKASFTREIDLLLGAISETRDAGWLHGTRVRLVAGPSEYLFGEETALLEVIDGRPPFPRITPPFRRGIVDDHPPRHQRLEVDGSAVLVDNVETLVNLPGILRHGARWYRSVGTERSPGTILCTITGSTLEHGVGEFAMGTPLGEVIDVLGGGVLPGREIKAVLSGVSNPPLGPAELDTPLSYEDMIAAGSGLGSGAFIVIDDDTSLVDVAAGVAHFLAVESCGQCEHCKADGLDIATSLRALDMTRVPDLLRTVRRGARCALAGQTERVVGGLLALAGDDRGTGAPYPILPLVDIVDGRAVDDVSFLEKRPDWTFGDQHASGVWPVERLTGHPVEIRPASVPEPSQTPTTAGRDDPAPSPLDQLRRLGQELKSATDALRTVPVDHQEHALDRIWQALARHRAATEHLVYPLVDRLDPEGADIAWYPAHHERRTQHLVDRLEAEAPLSPWLIDDLCAEVHLLVDELRAKVLPLLEERLRDDPQARLILQRDIEVVLDHA